MIYGKGARHIHWEKDSFFNGDGKTGKPQKNENRPLSYTLNKNELKWTKDLNLRPETTKPLGKSIGVELLDVGFGDDIFTLTPKENINK